MQRILATLVVCAAALCSAQAFAQQTTPAYDTTEVAPGIYTFRHGVHRSMFVVTDEGVIATDPLGEKVAPILRQEIRKVTDQPVVFLVYSHEHWDHISGGNLFKEEGATVVSQQNCLTEFDRLPNPSVPRPDITFADRYDLTLGGKTLELHHFGLSHGRCMIVMRLPAEKILFTVDLVNPKRVGFLNLPGTYPSDYIRYLKRVEKLEFDRIIPGHGPPTAPREAVAEYRQFVQDLDAAVLEAYAEVGDWLKVPAVAKQKLAPQYGDWGFFEEWIEMNLARVSLEKRIGW